MADGKRLPCKELPPHGKPWGFRPRNKENFIMTEKIEKGMDQGIEVNLTGYQYRDRKGTQYTVLKHSKDDLKIEVLNRRALK